MDPPQDNPEMEEDEFNEGLILPPLLIQLRKILDQYPDDSQILKELIQNAEDAGAREVKFMYDRHSYKRDPKHMHHPGLGKYQGPALYTYNDGLFDEEDWKGIRMLSQSIKQADPLKVGYFGMGFKSVFHLTDMPFVLSGERIGVIDPHCKFFAASSHAWSLNKRNLIKAMPHQFQPFVGIFSCTEDAFARGRFDGTLFRFPLRQAVSKLSDTLYNADRINRLFENFIQDAHLVLIFLRHLENVELYDREEHTLKPKLLYRVQISDDSLKEVRQKRTEFLNQTRTNNAFEKSLTTTYPIVIETQDFRQKQTITNRYRYLVTNFFSGGQVSALFRKLHKDTDLCYPPWVGTAMPLGFGSRDDSDVINGNDDVYTLTHNDGHVFCFLPLPVEGSSVTGLPVHVNGFFALEQNRKYIKWPSSYQSRDDLMDKRLLWNQCMLREALPKAYTQMILAAIRRYTSGSDATVTLKTIYRAFPDFSKVDRKWEVILPTMYVELLKQPVIHTLAGGGAWIEPKSAVFNTLDTGDEARDVIMEVLSGAEVKVAEVPAHVLAAIKSCCHINLVKITPACVAAAYKQTQSRLSVAWQEKVKLLRYLLRPQKYDLLDGLELLPLANGGFNRIFHNPRRADRPIYMASDQHPIDLLPGLDDDFLDTEVDDDIRLMLSKAMTKGYTQLRALDAAAFATLLPRCLPETWRGRHTVRWRPYEPGQPPDGWLETLWAYLTRHAPRDLQPYEELPLVPVSTSDTGEVIELTALKASRVLLVCQKDRQKLPKAIEEILDKVGVSILAELPNYIAVHPLISNQYIFSPTYLGVVQALQKLSEILTKAELTDKIERSLGLEQKRTLRKFFSKMSADEMSDENRVVLSALPIFESLKQGKYEASFVTFDECPFAAHADKLPVHIARKILDISDVDSLNLARALGVKELNDAQLLTDVVFPEIVLAFYDKEDVVKLMVYVLRHYHTYLDMDAGFRNTLMSLTFLPRKDILLTAERFYDPDDELLQRIFLGEENFPPGRYAEPSMVAILRDIGLRSGADIEPEDLRESAYQVQDMCAGGDSDPGRTALKSDALLDFLTAHTELLTRVCDGGLQLQEELANIKWVRRLRQKPAFYPRTLPWLEEESLYCGPRDMTHKQYSNMAGSVLPVVARDVTGLTCELFGWDVPPATRHLVRHLGNAVGSYKGAEKAMFMDMARNLYTELAKQPEEEVRTLLGELQLTDWAWHGEGFTPPCNLVFQDAFMDLRPYVYSVPEELATFSELFSQFGAQQHCHLPSVLRNIKEKHERGPMAFVEVRRDLHLCISVLNELKARVKEEDLPALREELVLPVHVDSNKSSSTVSLRMAALQDCTFCDMEWLRQGYDLGDLEEGEDRIILVHPNLPTGTSEALGVPTLMSRMLEAEELDFSFGQTDSLTHRLNVLLQEYTDGFAVPKELVQNADDAGATEVRILYDERQNENCKTCLIDEGMRECQGPALWAYNNAVFTDEDFENITKLSGATKETQTDKIGRFGLGFNAVYNITDVPSFVSRHNIVIFDPHTTHLGRSIKNKSKPGIKIDIKKHRKKLRRLGNQFKPYNDVFGCDLRPDAKHDSYNGTLFRFPLRTRTQAVRSEICQKHYDDREVKTLLNMLVRGAESLLLFTQNVVKVSIFHLPGHGRAAAEMNEIFTISKSPMRILRELSPPVALIQSAKAMPKDMQHFVKNCATLKASTIALNKIKNGVDVEKAGCPESSLVINMERHMTQNGARLLQKPGASGDRGTCPWLVVSHMGTGESLRMAMREEDLVPTAAVAVPVKMNTNTKLFCVEPITDPVDCQTHHGTVFTYLPLPIHTGLPVHVNGAFAVTSSRRYMCERNEDDKLDVRAIWNEALMGDAVCGAYILLLKDLLTICGETQSFHQLWPRTDYVDSNAKPLLNSFYQTLSGMNNGSEPPQVITNGKNWVGVPEALCLDWELQDSEVGATALDVFRMCVQDSDKVVVNMPLYIRDSFHAARADAALLKNTHDIVRFFQEVFLPGIVSVEPDSRDALLLYALRQDNPDLLDTIRDNACIPVSPAGEMLKCPRELVHPHSSLAPLYLQEDKAFPFGNKTYGSESILKVLSHLGMRTDDISWDDISERAESIQDLVYSVACVRTKAVLSFVQSKLERGDVEGLEACQKHLMEDLYFLPVMKKPKNFPLHWKADDLHGEILMRPQDMYPCDQTDLVCCVEAITDSSVFPQSSSKVTEFLGLQGKEAEFDTILDQLKCIMDSNIEQMLKDKHLHNQIQSLCIAVYNALQSMCSAEQTRKRISDELHPKPFLLCHNQLLCPSQMAFNFHQNCAPYLFSIPEFYRRNYTDLLKAVGVKDHFETSDFVTALQKMRDVYGDEVLDKDNLKLALLLANQLNDCIDDLNQTLTEVVEEYGTIYIPDASGVLRSASDLCFNEPDCKWVPTTRYVNYSHPLIPFTISKQLGVNTQRQEVLKKHSRGLAFGQRERLTNRIKRILSGYPCDKEILKELLQNADDSGATEIHFIKDPRQHPTERVFDDSWRPLQGPALCVYNNKSFREEDLLGIQRLGEGSKSCDPNKTGQYGVGFNCVYHLTDAPSFLTNGPDIGETLCVFDPHAKFVPGASLEEPGRRYDDVDELRKIFTNIFPCYLEDHYDLNGGTMFRFPLRTEQMAETSELSEQAVSTEMLDTLFARFRQEIFDCLLFINNVDTISLADIDKRTNQLTKSYTVSVKLSDDDAFRRKEFAQYVQEVSKNIKTGKKLLSQIDQREVCYTMELTDNKGYWEKWLVTQTVGFRAGVVIPTTVQDAFNRQDLALLPRGGVAALLDSSDPDAMRRQKKAFCFLPLPLKTGLPVHINGHFALDHEARRNLWQDDETSPKSEWNLLLLKKVIAPAYVLLLKLLPAQLNTTSISPNLSIMDVMGSDVPSIDLYGDLFPRMMDTASGYWNAVAVAVYRHIHETQEPVLPVVRSSGCFYSMSRSMNASSMDDTIDQVEIEWLSTTGMGTAKPIFDNLDLIFREDDEMGIAGSFISRRRMTSTPKKRCKREILRQVLLSSGFKLLKLPLHIHEAFQAAGVCVECITPEYVIDFYKSHFDEDPACHLGTLPTDIAATPFRDEKILRHVVEFCMQDDDHFYDNLSGLPFLLCEDGQLRTFSSEDPVYLSPYHDLLPGVSSMFTHHIFSGSCFKEVNPDSCPVFMRFDIESFASLLGNEIAEYAYKTEGVHAIWPAEEGTMPTPRWIKRLWQFLRSEYERILNLQEDKVDEEKLARLLVKPLREWCLLPAQIKAARSTSFSNAENGDIESQYLVPLGIATTAIDYSQASIMSYPVRECLRKLGIVEMSRNVLDGGASTPAGKGRNTTATNSNFAHLLVATLERPNALLHCLHYAREHTWRSDTLKNDESLAVLKYFNDCIDEWKDDDESKSILRDLPLYISVHGTITKLSSNEVYVLPHDIPQADMDVWEPRKGIVFIRENPSLCDLFKALNCQSLSVTGVYTKLIFKNFEFLSSEARITHMQYIKDTKLPQLRGDGKESFLEAIRELSFLPDEFGKLKKASEFHDPYHPVYKAMLENVESAFPPEPFSEFKWLNFLRLVGLQHTVPRDRLVEFAEEVAKEGITCQSDETFNKSRILVTHLFSRENLVTEGLLENIADIKFIPAAKVNLTLLKITSAYGETPPDGTSRPYISFNEGVPEGNEVFVWACSYLLPDWASPFKLTENDVNIAYSSEHKYGNFKSYQKEIAKLLGVDEEPDVDLVVEQAKKVCSVTLKRGQGDEDLKTFMKQDVMKRVYRFLQKHCEENQYMRKKLENISCIVVDLGQTFVKPKQVVINLYEQDQIMPYLYTAPIELGEFKQLFLYLGATLNATVDQYALVLENIYHETQGSKLHPNEMRAAFKSVYELFTSLQKNPHDILSADILYLPSIAGRMVRSCDLVFNDDPSYTDRIKHFNKQFLVDLNECKLNPTTTGNYEDMVFLLPPPLQPTMLTDLVQEIIENGMRHSGVSHGVAERLRHQLNSRGFSQAMIRLIRHEHRRSGHKVKQSVLDVLQAQLRRINVYGIDKLMTYLSYQGHRIMDSESEAECFVDKTYLDDDHVENMWNVYINSSVVMSEELMVSVAEVVNKIIGGLLRNSVHYIQPILSCAPHSISRVLDRLKIRPDHSVDYKQPTLPTPGSFIPLEDHHLLKEDFEEFEPSEYVGYELDDDESGVQTFVYATIVDKTILDPMDGGSTLRQMYHVNVGEDRRLVTAAVTDLYKFHRVERFVSRGRSGTSERDHSLNTSASEVQSPNGYRDSFYEKSALFEPSTPQSDKNPKSPMPDEVFDGNENGHTEGSPKRKRKNRKRQNGKTPEGATIEEERSREDAQNGFSKQVFEEEEMYDEDEDEELDEEDGGEGYERFARQKILDDKRKAQEQEEARIREQQEFEEAEYRRTHPEEFPEPPPQEEPQEGDEEAARDERKEIEVILNEVSDRLEEAWELEKQPKRKIIKRLLLKWHPDKNIDNERLATIITQHIQAEMERLEKGMPRPGKWDEFMEQFDFDPRNPFTGSASFQKNFASAYQYFFDQVNQRAKEHKEQRQRYKENFDREYTATGGKFNFDVPPSFSSANPQPAQARRFLTQAQEDLRAADNDYDVSVPAFEWVCFKAHQAAEKALKSAQFSVDAVTSFSHDLATLAVSVEDMELRRLAHKLQKIVGDSNKFYNPDPINFIVIPHDEYNRELACDAVMCAADILERVKEFVESRE